MSLKILQRSLARQDILDLIAYIANDKPSAAQNVFAAYEHTLTVLAENPEIGWAYPTDNPRLSGFRVFPIGRYRNYLIFYRYGSDTLDVIRVLHGMRDLSTILRDD
jgi:toxin ParE1/3/4